MQRTSASANETIALEILTFSIKAVLDSVHSKVPLGLSTETRGEVAEFPEKVEQSGKWPQQVCTTMFFVIPKNVSSERPIALMPIVTRLWEAPRAPEVLRWQQKYRVEWDATDGRTGGAERIVRETFASYEKIRLPSGRKRPRNDHTGA